MTSDRDTAADAPSADQSGTENAGRCEWCGEEFDTQQWHYPGTERTAEGELLLRVFCSQHCRAHWEYRDSTPAAGE
ncbi:hypothetical protein ACFQE1_11920 [Halobium palmae]|uniref:MYM-type domain-containing protein n=1 Tax=Halobium palmae TaxID=1776492 RepID=A0ABD5S0H6_9EURY